MNHTYRLVWNRALRVLQVASELARSNGDATSVSVASLPRRHPLAIACIALLTLGAFSLPAWAQECVPSATQTCGSQGGNAGVGGGGTSGQGGMGDGGGGQGAGGAVGAIGAGGNGGAGSYGDVQNPGGAGGSVGATSIGSVSITGGDGVTPPAGGNSSRGSGGGGGGGDGVYTTDINNGLAAGLSITGGNGGNGAPGDRMGGGGGGGGAGVVALTAAAVFTNAGSVTGGKGGDGAWTGWSGGGGGGGDGVLLAGASSTLNNSGTITGGNGGTGPQAGYYFGTGGAGGSGVNVTADNTQIINSGTIAGGLSANGTTRADAVKFWGTGESLTLEAGSVLNGAVEVINGASATISAGVDGLNLAGGTPAGDALIVDGATTIDTHGHALGVSGIILGSAPLTVDGGGTLILTGANTYSGTTTIGAGTVQVGDNAGTGSIGTGDTSIATGSALDFDRTGTVTYGGAISGGGALQQTAAGTLTLNGGSGAFAGSTEVTAGTLLVGDTAGNGAALGGSASVGNGATLSGFGSIGTANKLVEIKQGGILSPGAGTSSMGTLTVAYNLTLDQGSVLDFDLGAPDANNPQTTPGLSDHIDVDGTLTFDGNSTLKLTNAGSMGPGLYNLASYGSLAMDNCAIGGSGTPCVAVGSVPAGSQPYNFTVVNHSQNTQVDLYDSAGQTLDIWDPSGNTSQLGGTGTWTATSPTWTDPAGDGPAVMTPQPGFAIFQGTQTNGTTACATTACVVTIDDGANGANPVSASGMQFAVDGYTLAGDALTLVGTTSGNTTTPPIIEVGDGSSASTGMTATISAALEGTDGFTKTGAGTLVLTGDSSFIAAGGQQIAAVAVQAGTLQIGNGTLLGGGSLVSGGLEATPTMSPGTSLVLDNGVTGGGGVSANAAAVTGQDFELSTQTIGGGVSGILGIAAPGAGASAGSAITGNGFTATFTGNTFVAGNLAPAASQAVGAAAITGSDFQVTNASASGTYHGIPFGISGGAGAYSQSGTGGTGGAAISGSGFTVTNSGDIFGGAGGGTNTGTVGLGGAGVYSTGGSTVINEGTISGGASGAGQPAADAIDFTGGGNTLELVAGHPATFNGGIVVTRAAGDAADTLELGGDTASDTFDLSQMASGAVYGGFNAGAKTGGSTWTLQGTDTDTATWDVEAGTLVVGDDSHGSTNLGAVVTVAKGATITGIGTVGGLDLSGTLSPGGSIGTFHVAGDVTFEPGSTFQVEASPDGKADQLAATGKVTIKGGNTLVVASNGNWAPSTDYTIITAGNGVTGTFDAVSDNLAFLDPTLTYLSNAVNLELQRNETSFASVAQTPNQRNTAEGVNGAGVGNPLYKAVLLQDPIGARQAYDALSGEIYPTAAGERLEAARYVRIAMNQRLLQAGDDAFGADGKQIKGTAATIWSHAWGRSGHHDSNGNAARDTTNGSGLLVGVDVPVGNAHVGGLVGLAQQSTRVDDRGSSMGRHTTWLGLYGGINASNAWRVRGGVAYGHDRLESTRHVAFPGHAATVNASPDGHSTQAYIENALHLPINHGALEPYLNLAWTRVSTDGLTEHGGAAALHVAGNSQQATFGTLGVRGMWHFDNQQGSPRLALHAGLGWRHAFSGTTTDDTMNFAGQPQTFTIEGLPIAENAGIVQVGLDMALGKDTQLDLGYRGERGSEATDQSVHLQLAVNF